MLSYVFLLFEGVRHKSKRRVSAAHWCSTEDVVPFRQAGSSIVVPSAVSPGCPLRMSDCCCTSQDKGKKRGGPASITHTFYPHHPTRTMEHLQTSPFLFPRAWALGSHSAVQLLGGGAIVRPLSRPLIVPRRQRTASTHLNTLLGICSATALPPSALPAARSRPDRAQPRSA